MLIVCTFDKCDKNGTLSLWSSSPNPITMKNMKQTQIEEHFALYTINTSQNCQSHEKQAKTEKLSQTREN